MDTQPELQITPPYDCTTDYSFKLKLCANRYTGDTLCSNDAGALGSAGLVDVDLQHEYCTEDITLLGASD